MAFSYRLSPHIVQPRAPGALSGSCNSRGLDASFPYFSSDSGLGASASLTAALRGAQLPLEASTPRLRLDGLQCLLFRTWVWAVNQLFKPVARKRDVHAPENIA